MAAFPHLRSPFSIPTSPSQSQTPNSAVFLSSSNLLRSSRLPPMATLSTSIGESGTAATAVPVSPMESIQRCCRVGEVKRVTKETDVYVKINLDGSGVSDCRTGIPFLDHMLDQLASHGLLDLNIKANGDTHIDDHHTNEDVALAIGTALLQALGDRKGIYRFGNFSAPLDEAAVNVILDLSGRPHLSFDLNIPTQRVGTYDTQLVEHFFQSMVNTSGMTLHIKQSRSLGEIVITSSKQHSRHLLELCDKQWNMTRVDLGVYQVPKEYFHVHDFTEVFLLPDISKFQKHARGCIQLDHERKSIS